MDRPRDLDKLRKIQGEKLNQLYKEVTLTFTYQLQYGITYLAEQGVNVGLMADAFGMTPARVYQIIDKVRKENDDDGDRPNNGSD